MAEESKNIYGLTSRNMKKKLWLILPVLLVFVSITSFIAGMNFSYTSDHQIGQIVDTIILSPKQNLQTIDISGQLTYDDGSPYAHQLLEMHSTPVRVATDEQGRFTFRGIITGAHTLFLLDEDGNVTSSQDIYIRRSVEKDASKVEMIGVNYDIQVQFDTIEIYLNLTITKNNKLVVEKEILSLTGDGTVINERGIVTGIAIEFSKGLIKEISVEETRAAASEADETIANTLEQKAEMESESTKDITAPVQETEVAPEMHPPAQIPTEHVTTPEMRPEATKPSSGDSPDSGSTDPTKPSKPDTPLDVHVSDDKNVEWEQDATIDLFANRTGIGRDRKLAPGSQGSYSFKVANYNEYRVSYTIHIKTKEDQLLLPLKYRLKAGDVYVCGNDTTWLNAQQLYQKSVTLNSTSVNEYVLEWQWPFEGGNDPLDSKIGSTTNPICNIIVAIQITQM